VDIHAQALTEWLCGRRVAEVLRAPPLEPLETRILLCLALGFSRSHLITRSEHALSAVQAEKLAVLIARRQRGEPIAYITGEREFYGLPFHTTPAVLIPRPETELLVDLALDALPQGARVLDMGTGSGAIAVAIAHMRPDCKVTALDASTDALEVARHNASLHAPGVRLLHSNWYAALQGEQFDLIAANPPYIASGDRHLSEGDLRFEPIDALTDQGDGLEALRTIIAGARHHLHEGGRLLVEHGYDQAGAVRELMHQHGLHGACSWRDLAGIERISGAAR